MDRFISGTAALSRLFGVVAAGLIALSVLVVCHMVFVRYVLNHPTIWQTEFVTYAIIAATLLGSPYVLLKRGHVNVDLVPLWARPPLRRVLALLSGTVTILFVGYIAVVGAELWWEAWASDWHSDTVWRVPLWIPYAALPLGMGMLAIQAIADLAALLTGRARPFGLSDGVGFEAANDLVPETGGAPSAPLTSAAARPADLDHHPDPKPDLRLEARR